MAYKISINELQNGILHVVKRFPLLLAVCIFGTISIMHIVEGNDEQYTTAMLISVLALSTLVSIVLISESFNLSTILSLIMQFVFIGLFILYWYSMPLSFFDSANKHIYRFFGFLFASHLLVSFSAFIKSKNLLAFWDFNQQLFFRWLFGVAYSIVIYAGIAGAITAVKYLFDVEVRNETYGHLFAIIVGIIHPVYFLSGVPVINKVEDEGEYDNEINYGKALRILCIYILIPIVIIYLLILYAYSGKIILQWNWPKGWVANLVTGFSISGILTLLLIFPIRNKDDQSLARLYFKYFFIILMPIFILLYLSIGKRIGDYGFTEDRIIVLSLAIWLSILAIYFIFINHNNIRFIPISLFTITVLILVGPWSMFSISKNSQMKLLSKYLIENKILINGKVAELNETQENNIKSFNRFKITSLVNHLIMYNGIEVLQPLFIEPLDTVKENSRWNQSDVIFRKMGIEPLYYFDTYDSDSTIEATPSVDSDYFSYTSFENERINISGYDLMYKFNFNNWAKDQKVKIPIDSKNILVDFVTDSSSILIESNSQKYIFNLSDFVKPLYKNYSSSNLSIDKLSKEIELDNYRIKIVIENINGYYNKPYINVNSAAGYFLIAEKK